MPTHAPIRPRWLVLKQCDWGAMASLSGMAGLNMSPSAPAMACDQPMVLTATAHTAASREWPEPRCGTNASVRISS